MNRQQHIQETTAIQRRYEDKYFKLVSKVLQSEVDAVVVIMQRSGINSAIKYVHEHIHSKGLPRIVEKLYNEVGLRFARRQWRLLQSQKRMAVKGFGFNAEWVQYIHDHLFRFLVDKITFQVAETTRNILLTTLNKAIAEGWGIAKAVKEIEDLPFTKTQAARIVRTEITRAANTGTMAAGSTFDFQQNKEWIAAHDNRTRGNKPGDHASHVGLDGQVIDYEDVFTDPRNGDKLRYPGDPNASAESTVNCRCNIAVVAKVDQNGRLIPKRRHVSVIYAGQIPNRQTVVI